MRRLGPTTVSYAYAAVASFLWMLGFTVNGSYFVTDLGMSPFELVVVGTVMELAVFVFEVPTGIVALGGVGSVFGIRAALVAGAAVLVPALALYRRAMRHGGREPALQALHEPVEP